MWWASWASRGRRGCSGSDDDGPGVAVRAATSEDQVTTIATIRESLKTLANEAGYADTSASGQGIDTNNEILREGLDALDLIERNLNSIIVRCEQGDKSVDWLPTIARLATEVVR
jgi:hypothetical protein